MKSKYIYILIVAAVLVLLIITCNKKSNTSTINYRYLSENKNWIITRTDSTENSGHITLKKKAWMMHFIHWWSLTEEKKKLSVEYARYLLKSLWGMPFTLTGEEGTMKINGHTAYFVDGIYSNIVKTRFIVWNCHESGRQFLSDCNINISLNTPNELFELQVKDITKSISCHDTEKFVNNPKIPKHLVYKDENITFNIPSNYRSDFYIVNPNSDKKIPGHYENGLSQKRGVIWNLMTDSEKEINFIWQKSKQFLSESLFRKKLQIFFSDTTFTKQDSIVIQLFTSNHNIRNITKKNKYYECTGEYNVITKIRGSNPIDTSHYIYKAFFWKENENEHLLLASMVAHDNIWGIPFDLKPSSEQFNKFIEEQMLNNLINVSINIKDY